MNKYFHGLLKSKLHNAFNLTETLCFTITADNTLFTPVGGISMFILWLHYAYLQGL